MQQQSYAFMKKTERLETQVKQMIEQEVLPEDFVIFEINNDHAFGGSESDEVYVRWNQCREAYAVFLESYPAEYRLVLDDDCRASVRPCFKFRRNKKFDISPFEG